MSDLKSILVPVDMSETSQAALQIARDVPTTDWQAASTGPDPICQPLAR